MTSTKFCPPYSCPECLQGFQNAVCLKAYGLSHPVIWGFISDLWQGLLMPQQSLPASAHLLGSLYLLRLPPAGQACQGPGSACPGVLGQTDSPNMGTKLMPLGSHVLGIFPKLPASSLRDDGCRARPWHL